MAADETRAFRLRLAAADRRAASAVAKAMADKSEDREPREGERREVGRERREERGTGIKIVDVGTGSGCIAIALAKKFPEAEIVALDVSKDALEVARGNAALHHVEKNTSFLESDLLENLSSSFAVDVIVSNPPYIADGEIAGLPKEVRDFEPVRALQAGEDGLKVIRRLVTSTRRLLSTSGFIALEIGAGQRKAVEEIFGQQGYEVVEVVKDLQGHERVIVARPGK